MVVHGAGQQNRARLRHRLQARRDIDTIAVKVILLDEDIAQIDADPQPDLACPDGIASALGTSLQVDRALDGFNHASELDQEAVPHGLEDATLVLCCRRLNQVVPAPIQGRQRSGLIRFHEPGIVDDIGRQDR